MGGASATVVAGTGLAGIGNVLAVFLEVVVSLFGMITGEHRHQEKMEIEERQAEALERCAEALERIADSDLTEAFGDPDIAPRTLATAVEIRPSDPVAAASLGGDSGADGGHGEWSDADWLLHGHGHFERNHPAMLTDEGVRQD